MYTPTLEKVKAINTLNNMMTKKKLQEVINIWKDLPNFRKELSHITWKKFTTIHKINISLGDFKKYLMAMKIQMMQNTRSADVVGE